MSETDNWKLLVFRDGKRACDPSGLRDDLLRQIHHVLSLSDFNSQQARDELIEALLRAGELECALDDAGISAADVASLSDELARSLICRHRPNLSAESLGSVSALQLPERVLLSPPEGFCYYALHPLDYVDLLSQANLQTPVAAVIGIRSIGSTLSAVVKSALESRGTAAERITVRPTEHPFDRKLLLNSSQREWVQSNARRNAVFFIVDEGPGLSGSSFLSVAESVVGNGVPHDRIVLLPSAKPNLEALLAPNAAARWSNFQTFALNPTRYIPADDFIGGGNWRERIFTAEAEWPAVWSWTERLKYVSSHGSSIFRFDGHAHYGKEVRMRSQLLAEYGWGPEVSSAGDGFSVSPWLAGIRSAAIDSQTVAQLARYCAFRAEHFACEAHSPAQVEEMATVNLERALGVSRKVVLPIERPVIADARMMPHEWIRVSPERMLKVDAASHGDDHFYPGTTDIAWDLAGAITEWKLDEEAGDFLISEYQRISGDKVRGRLREYLIAYCAFRLAFTSSAAISVSAEDEQARFRRESEVYRQRLSGWIHEAKHDADGTDVTDRTDTFRGRMPTAECRVPVLHE